LYAIATTRSVSKTVLFLFSITLLFRSLLIAEYTLDDYIKKLNVICAGSVCSERITPIYTYIICYSCTLYLIILYNTTPLLGTVCVTGLWKYSFVFSILFFIIIFLFFFLNMLRYLRFTGLHFGFRVFIYFFSIFYSFFFFFSFGSLHVCACSRRPLVPNTNRPPPTPLPAIPFLPHVPVQLPWLRRRFTDINADNSTWFSHDGNDRVNSASSGFQ
jgi:hypothetical protein